MLQCRVLSHDYHLFTFDKKCIKIIIAFSKRDDLKMNGSSTGLGKNDTVAICNYCSKDVNVTNKEKAALTSPMKGKKLVDRSPSEQYIKSLMPPTPVPPLIIFKISLSGVLEFPIVNYHLKSYLKLVRLWAGVTNSKSARLIIEN